MLRMRQTDQDKAKHAAEAQERAQERYRAAEVRC
jgi:hypothetical protein